MGVSEGQAAVLSRERQQIDGLNGDDLKALREVKMANQLGRERERERTCHSEPIIVNLHVISTVLIAPRLDLTLR